MATAVPETSPEPPVLDLTKIAELRENGFNLVKHHGDPTTGEGCAADLIAWQTTGDITDMPPCVHNVFARLVHRINDDPATSVDDMWRLVTEVGPLVVGSADWPVLDVLRITVRVGKTVDGFLAAIAQRADLSNAVLSNAVLSNADLRYADLSGADLRYADLRYADLRGAVLRGADLGYAVLSNADLRYAVLSNAVLSNAVLRGADLRYAVLRGADLSNAVLRGADLSNADLSYAVGNKCTALPAGWVVSNAGLVVPEVKS